MCECRGCTEDDDAGCATLEQQLNAKRIDFSSYAGTVAAVLFVSFALDLVVSRESFNVFSHLISVTI